MKDTLRLVPEHEPGWIWLDTSGKVRHVQAARLEFRDEPPV